jgi:hypothetical protein
VGVNLPKAFSGGTAVLGRLVLGLAAAGLLAAPNSWAAGKDRQQAQARLLDHAEFLCDDCFFGPSKYYYCLEADNQILVGYQRVPALNYTNASKNYLTPVHHSWEAWSSSGEPITISYDKKHIWVNRPAEGTAGGEFWKHVKGVAAWVTRDDSKQVKLTRSSPKDFFTNDKRCRGANAVNSH